MINITRYEKAIQFLQNAVNSAAKPGNSYELNQPGIAEINTSIEALKSR